MNLKKLGTEIMDKVVQNRPMLATAAALGAAVLTGVIIFRESPKIRDILDERKEKLEKDGNSEEEVNKINADTMKTLACPIGKIFGGAVLTGALIYSINKAHDLKTEVLIAGYEVAKGKVHGYESILPEVVGEKKAEEISKAVSAQVANEAVKRNGNGTLIVQNDTECVCKDVFGNQWVGTYNSIEEAKNSLNSDILDCDCSLNDFYGYVGANRTVVGSDMMWFKGDLISIRYSSDIDEYSHKPIIVVDYDIAPKCMNKRYRPTDQQLNDHWRYGLD